MSRTDFAAKLYGLVATRNIHGLPSPDGDAHYEITMEKEWANSGFIPLLPDEITFTELGFGIQRTPDCLYLWTGEIPSQDTLVLLRLAL